MLIDKKTFEQLADNVLVELTKGHLGTALGILRSLLGNLENLPHRDALQEQAEALAADYRRLLQYMAQGNADPARASLQTRLIQRTFRTLQDLRRIYYTITELNVYTENAQFVWENVPSPFSLSPSPFAQTVVSASENDRLFTILWTSPQLRSNEEQEVRLFLCTTDEKTRCYMLSALTLSLLHYFDAAKLRLLMDYHASDSEAERSRVLLALCLVTQLHATPISLYPTLREDLILLSRQPRFAGEATTIQHYISLYRDIERLQKRLEQEIIPTLIKVSQQRHKLGFDDMEVDLSAPETSSALPPKTKKMLHEGMQEMMHLMQEGMDINLSTFTSLKRFPFFSTVGHWLSPFDAERPEVPGSARISQLPLCDSDKYSVALLLQHMPEEQREGMKHLMEEHAPLLEKHEQPDEYQNIIQCLYRLLRRSPWTTVFPDVFSKETLLIQNQIIGPELQKSANFLQTTGLTLLRHQHFEAAEQHLSLYAQSVGSDSTLLLQLGICAQRQGKFQRAIGHYQQAHMLDPENQQVLYHLQYCLAHLERYHEQLECLLKLEEKQPDEPKILTETGLCLIQLERWEEAARRFYKMEFREQRIVPSMRAIAWCALRQHNYQEARKYYQRILSEAPTNVTWEDFLNAGHTEWLLGDITAALPHYSEYAKRYLSAHPEATDVMTPFAEDTDMLHESGISKSDIQLMYDLVTWYPVQASE